MACSGPRTGRSRPLRSSRSRRRRASAGSRLLRWPSWATSSCWGTPSTSTSRPARSGSTLTAVCTGSWVGSGRSSPTRAGSRCSRLRTAGWRMRSKAAGGGCQVAPRSRSPSAGSASSPCSTAQTAFSGRRSRWRSRPSSARTSPSPSTSAPRTTPTASTPPRSTDTPTAGSTVAWSGTGRVGPAEQAVFGIVQGGVHPDLRRESAERTSSAGVDGIAIGGTLGRDKAEMAGVLEATMPHLPADAPRHLLGIGEVDDVLMGIERGIDLFDCAVPTRLARHGVALAPEPEGSLSNRPCQGAVLGRRRSDRRGLPVRGVQPPQSRLPPLPGAGEGADRGSFAHPP